MTWTATLRADQADRLRDGALAVCVRSGPRRVKIGVEAGSQEMLDWVSKDIKVEHVIAAAEQCRRHGLGAIFPFIVGFPSETDASVKASLRLIDRLRSMSPKFYSRFAWGPSTWWRRPLQVLARWRRARDLYQLPVEKLVVERLKPLPRPS